MFKIYQRMRAYSIYVTHTLGIRFIRSRYVTYTMYERCQYAFHTFVKACGRQAGFKKTVFLKLHTLSKICIRNAYAIVWLHHKKQEWSVLYTTHDQRSRLPVWPVVVPALWRVEDQTRLWLTPLVLWPLGWQVSRYPSLVLVTFYCDVKKNNKNISCDTLLYGI